MRRKLFALFSALSLLLFVAVCGLWVRSYVVTDRLFWQGWREDDDTDRSYWQQDMILSGRGGVGMNRNVSSGERRPIQGRGYRESITEWVQTSKLIPPFHSRLPAAYPEKGSVWGGFNYFSFRHPLSPADPRMASYGWQIVLPYWAIAATAAILPAISWRLWRRARRRDQAGLCAACGYDLRATPNRCPECGRVNPAALVVVPLLLLTIGHHRPPVATPAPSSSSQELTLITLDLDNMQVSRA